MHLQYASKKLRKKLALREEVYILWQKDLKSKSAESIITPNNFPMLGFIFWWLYSFKKYSLVLFLEQL